MERQRAPPPGIPDGWWPGHRRGEAVARCWHLREVRAASGGLDVGHRVTRCGRYGGCCVVPSTAIDRRHAALGVGVCCLERSAIFARSQARHPHGARCRRRPAAAVAAERWPAVLQSLPSLTVAHVLSARPGERVLDPCAAPAPNHPRRDQLPGPRGGVAARRVRAQPREARKARAAVQDARSYVRGADACRFDASRRGGGGEGEGGGRGGADWRGTTEEEGRRARPGARLPARVI